MREHVDPANVVTSLGLAAGFTALVTAQDSPVLATGLVAVAAGLDGLDGVLARRRGGERAFGGQLDSLADVVCFGVVPAATLWWVLLERLPVVGLLACAVFLVAGAWRLARFQLVQRPDRYVGLPIPAAGLLLMGCALLTPAPWLGALVTVALSALMVSTLSIPTLQAVAGSLPPTSGSHGPAALRRRHRPLRALRRRVRPAGPGPLDVRPRGPVAPVRGSGPRRRG